MIGAAKARKRNACLAAIEAMRRLSDRLTLNDAAVFLYVCENEGVNLRELSQLTGISASAASRLSRRLAEANIRYALAPSVGLIEIRDADNDRRSRTLFLTEQGRGLRDHVAALIADAHPILLPARNTGSRAEPHAPSDPRPT
ncbi:MAG: MarR family winged helix-turn-helix transcriptional regulator [Hyphomonadaceae bacterium]